MLSSYWTHRIITIDEAPIIDAGAYRYLKHPNYAIAIAEAIVLPSAFSAVALALIMTAIWAAVLKYKIHLENEALNSVYHQSVPPTHSSITPEYILSHVLDARAESFFAANYTAEIVTSPIYARLIRLKHFDFIRGRDASDQTQEYFTEFAAQNLPSIREAINSGNRTIGDFLQLLDKAATFKTWLQSINPDRGLVEEYYRRATEKTWADSLPTKSIRFAIASGLGLAADAMAPTGIGTTIGLTVGALDAFFLDKLIKGWRPNQFIEGPYKDFVQGNEQSES